MKQTQQDIISACFLQATPSLRTHVLAVLEVPELYLEAIRKAVASGLFSTLSAAIKSRILIALHIAKQHKALRKVLVHCEIVEIVKAVQFLDQPRQRRQLEKRIATIEQNHKHLIDPEGEERRKERPKKRRRTIDRLRRQLKEIESRANSRQEDKADNAGPLDSAAAELIESASVSGALSTKIRQWARTTLSQDFLEFTLLSMPLGNWKKLADVVHFKPSDFSLPYFLNTVHGSPVPDDTFVNAMQKLVKEVQSKSRDYDAIAGLYLDMAKQFPESLYKAFNFVRMHPALLRVKMIATDLAMKIPLSSAIWYLEELAQAAPNEIPDVVAERLELVDWSSDSEKLEHNKVTKSFGKLVERLLTFQSRNWTRLADSLLVAASSQLSVLQDKWAGEHSNLGTTIVLGDASSSMQSAIEAATILATMISVCCGAELSFFDHGLVPSPYPRPVTVEQTLTVCRTIRASSTTSLAAALWPYYEARTKVDRILLVTDEGENTGCMGYTFAQLLREYKAEVNPDVALIIICVDSGDECFRTTLANNDIKYRRFEIDGRRPDLTRFDSFLGQLFMTSAEEEATQMLEKVSGDEDKDDDFVVV